MDSVPQATSPAGLYLGCDGCKAGWFCAGIDAQGQVSHGLFTSISELETRRQDVRQVLIDIPIGLPGPAAPARECDRLARKLLGPGRGPSVFAPPARATLAAGEYRAALAINRQQTGKGISKQAWNIAPKIREVDDFLRRRPDWQGRLRESHPELGFMMLNRGWPMRHNKKTPAGQAERLAVLEDFVPALTHWFETVQAQYPRREVMADDILDALVLAVTAWRGAGRYRTLPDSPPRDEAGLPMEMVFIGTVTSDE
jgi:predicted RNase H-like nuclease